MIPVKIKSSDLRIKKTYKALINAIHMLLINKNFNQITVNDICSEALISRPTFYIHFTDKYDLLRYWLSNLNIYFTENIYNYDLLERSINQFFLDNKRLISNVIIDANAETMELIDNFVSKIVEGIIQKHEIIEGDNSKIISDFCSGGIIKMFCLQVKNNFAQNDFMTPFLYDMIKMIMKWTHDK